MGARYINLTQKYTRLFKQGWKPPPPAGKYNNAARAEIVLGPRNRENGLRLIEAKDGLTKAVTVQHSPAVKPASPNSYYIYFAADDSFKWSDSMRARLDVEYFDAGQGRLGVEYDGNDSRAPFNGAYTPGRKWVPLTGAKEWKKASFDLVDACFMNSENGQADFRLDVGDSGISVRRVTLVRE